MSSRATRLLHLLDRLHRARGAIDGPTLAQALGVSLRTLYRDIASLREQGARIEGEPGVGYRLCDGFTLPALMFDVDELEALVLGARWIRTQADAELAAAAERAIARIVAVLPEQLRIAVDGNSLFVPRCCQTTAPEPWLPVLRHAIRDERRLQMDYVDANGDATCRSIWPFAMAFFDPKTRSFAAWCELREDFRHFRADRVIALADTGQRYPVRRHLLLRRWRATTGYTAS